MKKGKSTIELRGAEYTERGLEYPIRIPIPGLPADKRPVGMLVCTRSSAEPHQFNFGGTFVEHTGREALWIVLQTSLPMMQLAGGLKVEKRLLDLSMLAGKLDMELVRKILAEKPGLYFGKIPLVTPEKLGLIKFLELGAKLKGMIRDVR